MARGARKGRWRFAGERGIGGCRQSSSFAPGECFDDGIMYAYDCE